MQAKTHHEPREGETRRALHAGTRTCTGCGRRVEPDDARRELVRVALVRDPDGVHQAHADVGGSSFGRGAWVHARRDCLERAAARGLARSAKGKVRAEAATLAAEIAQQAERRAWALLGSARRSRRLAFGADAVCAAITAGDAALVIVARDARAAASRGPIQAAIGGGGAVAFGDKRQLGAALDRDELGVIAVLDPGIAEALRHALSLVATFGHPLQQDEIGPDIGARQ
jgi:predicted RNA-binding protein YlxR (DUF448 family)